MVERFRVYGDNVTSRDVGIQVADHILGTRVELDNQRRPDQIAIQFQTTDGVRELRMDFVQAMFVLSTLKSIQLDTKTPFPDDPRGDRNNPLV